jgi:hypothetical protein
VVKWPNGIQSLWRCVHQIFHWLSGRNDTYSHYFQAQLRATAQKLGQLQQRKDGEAKIKRRDIATLLQTNIGIARDKAQNLIQEEILGNVLEVLEMQIGVILERIVELEPG